MRRQVLALSILFFTTFSAAAADRLMYCPIFVPRGTPNLYDMAACAHAGGPNAEDCNKNTTALLKGIYLVLLASNRAGQYAFEKYSFGVVSCGMDRVARSKAMEMMLDLMPDSSPDKKLFQERLQIDNGYNFRNLLKAIGTIFVIGDFIENHYADQEMDSFGRASDQVQEVTSMASDLGERAAALIRSKGLFPSPGH